MKGPWAMAGNGGKLLFCELLRLESLLSHSGENTEQRLHHMDYYTTFDGRGVNAIIIKPSRIMIIKTCHKRVAQMGRTE